MARHWQATASHRRDRHGKAYSLTLREQVIAARHQGFGPKAIGGLVGLPRLVVDRMLRHEREYHKVQFPPIRRMAKPIRVAKVELSHKHGVTAREMATARGMTAAKFLSTLIANALESPMLAENLMDDQEDLAA